MLSYIFRILNNLKFQPQGLNFIFINKPLKNTNTNKSYSFFFKNFFNHIRSNTLNFLSLQKINYLTLHTASAGRWVKIRVSYALNS
jgi:hypothetical protein